MRCRLSGANAATQPELASRPCSAVAIGGASQLSPWRPKLARSTALSSSLATVLERSSSTLERTFTQHAAARIRPPGGGSRSSSVRRARKTLHRREGELGQDERGRACRGRAQHRARPVVAISVFRRVAATSPASGRALTARSWTTLARWSAGPVPICPSGCWRPTTPMGFRCGSRGRAGRVRTRPPARSFSARVGPGGGREASLDSASGAPLAGGGLHAPLARVGQDLATLTQRAHDVGAPAGL